MTWGWINNDRIFIFGWTIPLSFPFISISHPQLDSRESCVVKMALTVFNNQCCEVENQGMCSLIMLTSCKVMKTVWLCLCCLSLQLSQLFPDECLEKLLPQMPGLDSTHELDPRYFYFWILTQTENKFSIKSSVILGLGYNLNIYNIHFKFSCKNTELYIESLFAKNDKRHLKKKWVNAD